MGTLRHSRYQAAIIQDGAILLLCCAFRDGRKVWMLPGGGREETEDAAACVAREVREETGLAVRVERLLLDHSTPPAEKSYARWRTYLCSVLGGEAAPGGGEGGDAELIAVRWLALDDESQWPVEIKTDPLLGTQLHAIQAGLRVPSPIDTAKAKEPIAFFDQSHYSVRFEWGESGLDAIASDNPLIVIVDVLSFSTSVEIATAQGAEVFPYRWRDETAVRFANERQAILADAHRGTALYSLSPTSLVNIPSGARLVLPSPNGAAISCKASRLGSVVAACLRNAAAVGAFVRAHGGPVAVIGCGERWTDGSLRPAWEDMVGAGALISELPGTLSPEARAACDAFRCARMDLPRRLESCASGRELMERGFTEDVELASALGVSDCVPILTDGVFKMHR